LLRNDATAEETFAIFDAEGRFSPGTEWRGVCGETVWHIAFLLMGDCADGMIKPMGQLAKLIYERNPWFVNSEYTKGVYEGEVALHLAIAHTDVGSTRWLLEQGADLEHNAIGSFFGRFRWGEHPVAWAACGAKVEILELLLESKADFEYRDTRRSSILHDMALAPPLWDTLQFKKVYASLEKHDANISKAFVDYDIKGRTPLQIASAYQEGNFHALMDCLCKPLWTFGGVKCTAHLLSGWDSAHSAQYQEGQHHLIGTPDEEVSAVEVAVLQDNPQFFCTPLNQLLIKGKWTLFVRHEFMQRALYFLILVLLSTASALIHDGYRIAIFLRLWSFLLAVFMLMYYSLTFIRVRRTLFFKRLRNKAVKVILLDLHKSVACIFVLVSICLQTYLDFQELGTDHHRDVQGFLFGFIMPLSLLVAWICTSELLLLHEYLSNVLLVIVDIVKLELPVWFVLQMQLLGAFSSAIYISTAKVYNEEQMSFSVFGSFLETLLALALVPLGGIADVEQLMASDYDFVVCMLYFGYSSLSCVLFLNLTISLFTERTREFWFHRDKYYFAVICLQCIAEEKRRRPQDLRRYWIGSQLGDGKHYLLVQKFDKPQEDGPLV